MFSLKCLEGATILVRRGEAETLVVVRGVHEAKEPPTLDVEGNPERPPEALSGKGASARDMFEVTISDILQKPVCAPGSCVLTSIGTGVLVAHRRSDDVHIVRLWGPMGSGSGLAYISPEALLRPISAAVGLEVVTPLGAGVVKRYRKEDDTFIVNLGYGTGYLQGKDIQAPVAGVMPLVERVAEKARALVKSRMRDAHKSGAARKLLESFAALEPLTAQARRVMGNAVAAATYDQQKPSLVDALVKAAEDPKATENLQAMLKAQGEEIDALIAEAKAHGEGDDFIGGLLKGGRDRIDALLGKVASGDGKNGLTLEKGLEELRLLVEGADGECDLRGLIKDLQTGATKAEELKLEFESTKAGTVLKEGGKQLGAEFKAALDVYGQDPELAQVKANSERLASIFLHEESPAMKKAKSFADKARERFEGRRPSSGTRESLLGQARSVEAELGRGLQKNRSVASDIMALLRGNATHTASDQALRSMERMMVRWLEAASVGPPAASAEEAKTLAEQEGNKSSDRRWKACDLVPMFEAGTLPAAVAGGVLRRMSAQAVGRLNKMPSAIKGALDSVDEDTAGGAGQKVKETLEGLSSGSLGVDDVFGKAIEHFNSPEGEKTANELITLGGERLEDLKRGGQSEMMRGLIGRLADPNIEKKIAATIESIDADEWLDMGERALTDEAAREVLLGKLKDSTVTFLLDVLPTIRVPPISGVTESNVNYTLTNLDMSGFHLRKEDVELILPDRAWMKSLEAVAGLPSDSAPPEPPPTKPKGRKVSILTEDETPDPFEVFSIVARDIHAEFNGIRWAVKQGSFPYGAGAGTADAKVVKGSVRISFSLRRGELDGKPSPLLVMSRKTINMQALNLVVANTRLSWLLNLLVNLFTETIKQYVIDSLIQALTENASELLGNIHRFAKGHWSILLSLVGLDLDKLPVATEAEQKLARGECSAAATGSKKHKSFSLEVLQAVEGVQLKGLVAEDFTVVFHEEGPLGLQVDMVEGGSMRVVVSNLFPGGQAERMLSSPASRSMVVGSEVVQVGEELVTSNRHCIDLLKNPIRPVVVTFRLYVPDLSNGPQEPVGVKRVRFTEEHLGIRFRQSPLLGDRVTLISGFNKGPDGKLGSAETDGLVKIGQILYSVNNKVVLGLQFSDVVSILRSTGRPVEFGLLKNPDTEVLFNEPPADMELEIMQGHFVVTGIKKVPSPLVGKLGPGDTIISVNGIELPSKSGYESDVLMFKAAGLYPLSLKFIRTLGQGATLSPLRGTGAFASMKRSIRSIDLTVNHPLDLSVDFNKGIDGRPAVLTEPKLVDGPAKRTGEVKLNMVLLALDEEPFPPSVTAPSDVWKLLYEKPLPLRLTMRDMTAYLALQSVLASKPRGMSPERRNSAENSPKASE